VHLSRKQQRVEDLAVLAHPATRLGQPRQFRVEECEVERRIVDNELSALDELEQLRGDVSEARLPAKELGGEAVHLQRPRVDLAVRAEVTMEDAPCPPAVHDLDAADLDDAMPEFGLEARRLGVEDDLTHQERG